MKLNILIEEYIKTIDKEAMSSDDDYTQLCEELRDSKNLTEFLIVVSLWSNTSHLFPGGTCEFVLNQIIENGD